MSKNSKNARKVREAKRVGEQRKKGNKGPARTKKVTTKKLTWFAKKDNKLGAAMVAIAEAIAAKRADKDE